MKKQYVLARVFKTSSVVIVTIILSTCLVCKWPATRITAALLASMVISLPALVSLHVLLWLSEKRMIERGFMWMLLLSFIPVLSLVVAWLLAGFVPGKTGIILVLGMVSGYAGLFANSFAVSQFFNSSPYERERNNSID